MNSNLDISEIYKIPTDTMPSQIHTPIVIESTVLRNEQWIEDGNPAALMTPQLSDEKRSTFVKEKKMMTPGQNNFNITDEGSIIEPSPELVSPPQPNLVDAIMNRCNDFMDEGA